MRAALALLLAPYALSAYAISGTVRERSEDKLKPLAKALVVARTPNGKDVLGATRSDSEGRYTLPGPFKGQVRVSAGRGGYFVHSAGGTADPYVAVNCDAAQCGAFDFELAKAAVIRGKVVDDLGELVVSAQVQATMPEEQDPQRRIGQARTDDRGEYRIFGLRPGVYELRAHAPNRGLEDRTYVSAAVKVEIVAGEERALPITIRPALHGSFRVAGVVTGIELDSATRSLILMRALKLDSAFPANRGSRSTSLTPEGAFEFTGVPPGIYEFRFNDVVRGRGATRSSPPRVLDVLDIRSDLEGLSLSPMPPTGIKARIELQDSSLGIPPPIIVRSEGLDTRRAIPGGPPGYQFSDDRYAPGIYSVSLGTTSDVYLKSIEIDGVEVEGREIEVPRGRVIEARFVVSGAMASVSGQVKRAAEGGEGPFRVGLKSEIASYSVQADQAGRFVFAKVPPGEYRIGAWALAGEKDLKSESLWREVGAKAPKFTVEESSEVEISLTAVR